MNARTLILTCCLCALALLQGCQSQGQTPIFQHSTPVDSNNGMLYLYRPKAPNPGRQPLKGEFPAVLINEEMIGAIRFNQYLALELPPGTHDLRISGLVEGSNWSQRELSARFTIARGSNTFMKLDVRFNLDEMVVFKPGAKYHLFLRPVREEDAIYEIRDTVRAN